VGHDQVIVIATTKSWNVDQTKKLKKKFNDYIIHLITEKDELTYSNIEKIKPDWIFFPHWSWIIPEKIYNDFRCVVFHMTDLPYGRGGSPLQNLIIRGHKRTKISAIEVVKELDAGNIYLKEGLTLEGTADEIFKRASEIIFNKMIPQIIKNTIISKPQEGTVKAFKRRKPDDSKLTEKMDLNEIYDFIRMLDGEGYPRAFINFGDYVIKFEKASLENGKVIARAEIIDNKK
jgi:methionyl-tRNA formyltransferase